MRDAKQKARWRRATLVSTVAAVLVAGGCANDRGPHPELPRLGVITGFTSHNLCGLGVSPEIRIVKPPPDAATYRIKMTLVSALTGPSWEFTMPAPAEITMPADPRQRGVTFREGAIPDFPAPCVPETEIPQYFYYRMELMAQASNGQPIAYGWSFAVAYSLTRQLGLERGQYLVRQRERAAAAARGQPLPDDQPTTAAPPAGLAPRGMLATPPQQSPTAAQERPADQAPDASASASGASTPASSGAPAPSASQPSASQSSESQRTASSPPAPPAVPRGPRIVPRLAYPPETTAFFFTY